MDGVLPTVLDREETAKDKCLSIMEDTILSKLHHPQSRGGGAQGEGGEDERFVWRLLNIIAEDEEQDLRLLLLLLSWACVHDMACEC